MKQELDACELFFLSLFFYRSREFSDFIVYIIYTSPYTFFFFLNISCTIKLFISFDSAEIA